MSLPPIVERELLAGGRRRGFYWLRCTLALVAAFQCYECLNRGLVAIPPSLTAAGFVPPASRLTGATLLHQMTAFQFLAALSMGLLTVNSIYHERRDGTLGLLLLTDLTPAQIIYGKMLSCGLTSFYALLGAVPAVMVPVLAGGVRGAEAIFTGLGILNAQFVALAAGLWMSALFQQRRHAVIATFGLVGGLAIGPDLLGQGVLGPNTLPELRLLGLAGWLTAVKSPLGVSSIALFVLWLLLMQSVGWAFLRLAAMTLMHRWQEDIVALPRRPEQIEAEAPSPPDQTSAWSQVDEPGRASLPSRASRLTDPRPWDASPVQWRMEQLGSPQAAIWIAVGLNLFAQFGVLGAELDDSPASPSAWGLLSFVGLTVMLISSGLLAWAGARFFQHAARQHELELLLTTPMGSEGMLAGQWHVLRRALSWPLGLVLALALPAGISLLYDFSQGHREELWFLLPPFLVALNLACEALALCWAGMRFGLRAPNPITAIAQTVILVQLVPLALVALATCVRIWLLPSLHPLMGSASRMPAIVPVLLFFIGKNLFLIYWARRELNRDLRLYSGAQRLRREIRTRHKAHPHPLPCSS
jgi:ABC-2 family transporter protein